MTPGIKKMVLRFNLSFRLLICVLLTGLCLVASPGRSAKSSANSVVRHVTGLSSRSQDESIAARVSGLNGRASINQLPAPDETGGVAVSMATGDFDENGVQDLIVGSAGPAGFFLNLYPGNEDAVFPDTPRAKQRGTVSRLDEQAPLSFSKSFPLADAPGFLAAGDFNSDGHVDVATAARAGHTLYLLLGDGHGDFQPIQSIELTGRITAVGADETTGSVARTHIAIGIVDNSGPATLLFESLEEASRTRPAIVRLHGEATEIVFRRPSLSNSTDVLIAAGRELLVVSSDVRGTGTSKAFIHHRSFSSVIISIAIGSFAGDQSSDVAVLTADGAVNLIAEGSAGDLRSEGYTLGAWPQSTRLVRARISGSQADDLVLLDPNNHRLNVLAKDATTVADWLARTQGSISLDTDGDTLAVLPMRLNENAPSGLVVLSAGRLSPATVVISAAMTYVVTNTNDSGVDSLRQAILDANGNAGTDTINFNIPGPAPHTISLVSPLPALTESATINGTSQPDFAGAPVVELNGLNAGVGDGLTINAASCVVRGLIINRFNGNGISIAGNGNIIEGNFIGTNATGIFALGNSQDGVSIASGSGNTVGGTTSAARNLLSGNRNGIQIFGGSGTQVRGNFIGTNAAGTGAVGNSLNGVLINVSSGNAVGAVGSASSNTVAFNGAAGVAVTSGNGNSILSNSIFLNGGLGIDLDLTGVTPNDLGDGDSGANNRQNFPVLDSASAVGTSTAIVGTLNSTASTIFRLEFFSNQAPNPSGFGEGQTLIGAITVTTDASGNASFNPTFPVTVAPGQIVTATATDPSNNTSEFSKAIQVGGVAGGTPADLSVITSIAPNPVQAGSDITKTIIISNAGPATATSVVVADVLSANTTFASCNSTGGGVCGGTGNSRTITFPSLAPGSTAIITIIAHVNCSVPNGAVIGNTATVFSSSTPDANPSNNVGTSTTTVTNTPPTIACPASITQSNDSGNCTATVNYPTPVALDNCTGVSVQCSPAAGSSFAIGTTTVTCVARDAAGATASCTFTVTVNDVEPLILACPSNVTVTAAPGQCTPAVNFPSPAVIDNCPGSSVACVPPAGSSFPLGVTNVLCTAIDAKGAQVTCGFTVTVNGSPLAVVTLEGNASPLEFGPVPALRKAKKLKKQKARSFTVENVGCLPLVLTFDSINRVGNDVDRGRIGDPDDRRVFTLYRVDPNIADTEIDILTDIRIAPGQKQNFKVRFHPLIPVVANDTRGLPASKVIPDLITSELTFRQNGGAPIRIDLVGHVETAVSLTDPDNPRNGPKIVFSRIENQFIIEYTIYDSNLDVNKATYQFFDRRNRPVGQLITVNLTGLIEQSGFVRGQTFTVLQRINGAEGHGEIVGVSVTVFDNESSEAAPSATGAPGDVSANTFSLIDAVRGAAQLPDISLPPDAATSRRQK